MLMLDNRLKLELIETEVKEFLYERMDLEEEEYIDSFIREDEVEFYIVTEYDYIENGEEHSHRQSDFLFLYNFKENTGEIKNERTYMSLRTYGELEDMLIDFGRNY